MGYRHPIIEIDWLHFTEYLSGFYLFAHIQIQNKSRRLTCPANVGPIL